MGIASMWPQTLPWSFSPGILVVRLLAVYPWELRARARSFPPLRCYPCGTRLVKLLFMVRCEQCSSLGIVEYVATDLWGWVLDIVPLTGI